MVLNNDSMIDLKTSFKMFIGLLFIYGNIVAENKCSPGWNFERDICIDIDECKQKGKEINLSEDICAVSTWTSYSMGQEVSENHRFYLNCYQW